MTETLSLAGVTQGSLGQDQGEALHVASQHPQEDPSRWAGAKADGINGATHPEWDQRLFSNRAGQCRGGVAGDVEAASFPFSEIPVIYK